MSRINCNKLLTELAKHLNLVELEILMDFDADSFGIIKSFRDLEVLSMIHYREHFKEAWFSDATVFPPKLKRIQARSIKMSCSAFLSIVKQLKFLEQFDVHCGGIFLNHDQCKLLHQKYAW